MRVEIYGDANRKTVSGPTVKFTADDAAPVTDLKAQIAPSIAGYSAVTIAANGQNTNVSLTKSVYGGSADITTGVVTETHGGGAYNPTAVPSDLSSKIVSATTARSASGSVASFNCSLGEYPMSALTAAINPVQDLHGYDHPWPGGGGKNKLPNDTGTTTLNGVSFIKQSDGSVLVNGTASADISYDYYRNPAKLPTGIEAGGSYILSNNIAPSPCLIEVYCSTNGTSFQYVTGLNMATSLNFTVPTGAVGLLARIKIPRGNTFSNMIFKPMIRLATETDATFAPYSNICPITGWTGATVTRTGKNLLPKFSNRTDNGVTVTVNDDGSVTLSGTATANAYFSVGDSGLPSGNYIFSFNNPVANSGVHVAFHNTKGEYFNDAPSDAVNKTVRLQNREPSTIILYVTRGVTLTNFVVKPQLESGSTATDYEPYQGDIYAITFPTAAGTVYGGTLDVTTGTLTVDRAICTENDFTKVSSGFSTGGLHWADFNTTNITINGTSLCSSLGIRADGNAGWASTVPCYALSEGVHVRVYCEEVTLADFRSKYAGLQICYPLATPVTYQLTPQEVSTLLGTNNLWADTGDVTVSYRDGLLSNVSGIMTNSTALTTGENITYTLSQERTFQIPGTVIRTVVGDNVMSASTGNISVTWSFHWFDITPWIAYQGLTFSRNDVDAPDAGRDMSGYMHRGRVGVKEKMNVTTVQLTRAQSSTLQTLLYPETIQVRVTPYPRTNTSHTMSMYTNNVKTTYVIHRKNGEDLQSLTFPLIEN